MTYIKRSKKIKTPNLNQTTKSFFKVILSSFQRFHPISAFYPHFSVLSPFQFPVSVSTIQFQCFIPTPLGIPLGLQIVLSFFFCMTNFFVPKARRRARRGVDLKVPNKTNNARAWAALGNHS